MVTGAKFGAGTDANVFITLFGEKHRQSGRIHLKHADGELFERGHTDTFVIHAADVGRLTKIRWVLANKIAHCQSGTRQLRPRAWLVRRPRAGDESTDEHASLFRLRRVAVEG